MIDSKPGQQLLRYPGSRFASDRKKEKLSPQVGHQNSLFKITFESVVCHCLFSKSLALFVPAFGIGTNLLDLLAT